MSEVSDKLKILFVILTLIWYGPAILSGLMIILKTITLFLSYL